VKLFPLDEAFEYGKSLDVQIQGRSIISQFDAGLLAQMVVDARHGDHVEIGTLFGGSAIVAALAKREFDLIGQIHCVDPLNNAIPDRSGILASPDLIMENAKLWEVEDRIVIHRRSSYPFPIERTFATGYIDGDHWNNFPAKDWDSLKQVVSYMVMFDDYCRGKPEVVQACLDAAQDPDWIPVFIGGISFILRRRE
jgi:cephalosporin hydroxylase